MTRLQTSDNVDSARFCHKIDVINSVLQFLRLSAAWFGLIASSACAAKNTEAVSYEVIELPLPNADADRLDTSPSSPKGTRLRMLVEELEDSAARAVGSFGEEPIVETEQAGNRGEKILIYAASPKGAVGYFAPFFGHVESDSVRVCRFELRPERLDEFPRVGTRPMLLSLWPGANCESPAPNMAVISDWQAELATSGYKAFAAIDLGDGAQAAVIELPDSDNGEFGVEAALDHYLGPDRQISRSIALPMFGWRAGVAEIEDGDRLFYFDDERMDPSPRRICIVEGISWDEFRDWERGQTSHPLKEFCKKQLRNQREAQSERYRTKWEDSPPLIITREK